MGIKVEARAGLTAQQQDALAAELLPIVLHRQMLKQRVGELETEIDTLSTTVKDRLSSASLTKLKIGEHTAHILTSDRRSISRERLLDLGVPIDVIEQATEMKSVTSFRIDGPKTKGDRE